MTPVRPGKRGTAITRYGTALVSALAEGKIPKGIRNEGDLERKFVVPAAAGLVARHAGVRVFSHPWGNPRRCAPDCSGASASQGHAEPGCPQCWARSKGWSAVAAFGTRHNFDLAASHRAGGKLAVEVKFVTVKGGRMPNGEIQRLLGQCALAASKHEAVIGFCGYRGRLNENWTGDTSAVTARFRRLGVDLVFREVP